MIIISIIDLTEKCNLRCTYCCRKSNNFSKPDNNCKVILDAIQQIIKMRGTFVVLQGGEPLLYNDVIKLLEEMSNLKEIKKNYFLNEIKRLISQRYDSEYFRKKYLRIIIEQFLPLYCITTNGMIYSDEIETALYNGGFSVEVSLDSSIPQINNLGRVGSDFTTILNNIRKYTKRLPVEISCTITENNVENIIEMLDFTQDMNCICLKFSPVIMIGRRKDDGRLWEGAYIKSLKKAVKLFREKEYNFYLKIKLNQHVIDDKICAELLEEINITPNILLEKHTCNACSKIKDIYIDTGLNVFGCASMKNIKDLTLGNIKESSLNSIWYSETRKNILNKIREYANELAECGSCTAVAYSKADERI